MTSIKKAIEMLVTEISPLEGVTTRPGISNDDLFLLEERLQLRLPEAYRELLLLTNGLELMFHTERILGSGPGAPIDIEWFNDANTWMFAYRWWRDDLEDFLVLAFGVECGVTACRRADLEAHIVDPPFYSLHPASLQTYGGELPISQWLLRGVRVRAQNPRHDVKVNRILDRFGPVPPDRVLMPPATGWLATADEEPDEGEELEASMLLPVAEALIGQADLLRHSRELRPGDQVHGVDTWTDEQGRTRLRYRVSRPGR